MSIGLRPDDFWKLKPVELWDIAESYGEREREKEKEEWRRAAFIASWIINTAGKSFKRDITADSLINFKDEVRKVDVEPIDPKERKKQADKVFMLHKSKCWMLLNLDEGGKVKVFDREKLNEIKERYKKK